MSIPTPQTLASILVIFFAVMGALLAAFWLSSVIWVFRDMRLRSRDPFAQILAAVLAMIPIAGWLLYLILRPPETLTDRYERALEEEALLQEIEERPHCHNCSRTVQGKWVVCPTCFVELKKQCVGCTSLLDLGWKVCPHCATEQPDSMRPLNKKMLRQQIKSKGKIIVQTPTALPAVTGQRVQGKSETHIPRVKRRYHSVTVGKNGRNAAAPLGGDYVIGEPNNPTVVSFAPTAEELARLERQMAAMPDLDKSSTIVPVPPMSSAEITQISLPVQEGEFVDEVDPYTSSAEMTVVGNVKRRNGKR